MIRVKIKFGDNHEESHVCYAMEVLTSGTVLLFVGGAKDIILPKGYKEVSFTEFEDAGL